jgi:hypothetical protein
MNATFDYGSEQNELEAYLRKGETTSDRLRDIQNEEDLES